MIEIKHRITGDVLFAGEEAAGTRGAVEAAVTAYADLASADLARADLTCAYLGGANLAGAYLTGADLTRAKLAGAYLTRTILDPTLPTNKDGDFAEIDDGECVGYRTRHSPHVGDTIYEDGEVYRAEFFSVCPATACHPGLYCYPTADEVRDNYPDFEAIEVRFRRNDLHAAGGKYRVRAFRVIGKVEDE